MLLLSLLLEYHFRVFKSRSHTGAAAVSPQFSLASNFGSHIERVEASGTYADALYAFDCAFVCESCPRPRRGAPVTS